MNVDRGQLRNRREAEDRVAFCLDRLEAADFCDGVDWETRIVPSLTLRELIGAVVAAELDLKEYRENLDYYTGNETGSRFYGFTCPACGAYHKSVEGVRFADGRVQIQCRECSEVDTVEPRLGSQSDGMAVIR